MPVDEPPIRLSYPNIVLLPTDALLERVHDLNYEPIGFNPCQGALTRFAPIHDARGNCVPSLYAADTLEAAIYETVFHDVPVVAKCKTVRRTLIQNRAHSRLRILRGLCLASLRGPDLRQWDISRNSLIATSPKLYRNTARWAEAIHHQFPDIEGLLWTSNQCDPDTAYIFFGDRVFSEDFELLQTRSGMDDTTFLSDVRRAGKRSGIGITV